MKRVLLYVEIQRAALAELGPWVVTASTPSRRILVVPAPARPEAAA